MSNVLYCQSTQSVIQPHLLVQSGDANDIVGLDPDYLILQKVEVIPEYNPATQSATEQWTVNLESLEYRQSWTIVDLPNWKGFNIAILTNQYWASWEITQDLRTSIISAAISRLPEQLQAAYDLAKSLTPPSNAAIEDWQTIADQYHITIVF